MINALVPTNVLEKLKVIPAKPGCYIYKSATGEVLYVGKALNLRSRVRSYFRQSARHGLRIARLVSKTSDMEWIVVDSELEALVLECNLIKQHRPPFNVRLRDDKSYPYIAITSEKFPRLLFTRKIRKDGSKYFGPFSSAWAVRDMIQLLHKAFPLIPCGKSWSGKPEQRPCLYYHLGQCMAPCAGLSDPVEYAKVIEEVEKFLRGRSDTLLNGLKSDMEKASVALEFEKAALIRDRIKAVESVLQRQKVLSHDQRDRDVIAVVRDERGAAVQMLYIRGGKLIGQRQFLLDGSSEAPPGEAVQEFIKQYYSESPEIPREILLPVEIEEHKIVHQWLEARRGSSVILKVPRGGEKLKLIEMAASNAEQAITTMRREHVEQDLMTDQSLEQLAEALELQSPPVRIEGYDISNIQGTSPVGSMVVIENGEAAKSEYRRFKIRYHPEDPNDFAMMHEVITRRLKAYLEGDEKFARLPDLVLIDGGKGQLNAALMARDELGLTVPMIGLAKRLELIYRPTSRRGALAEQSHNEEYRWRSGIGALYDMDVIELPLNSPGLMLLRRLRDEAHRFALTFHRKIRDKRVTGSVLDEIPGIGPRRRRMLLRTFGSIEGIRRASVEELAAVPTMTHSLAKTIREYLEET